MASALSLSHFEDDLLRSHNRLLRAGLYGLFALNLVLGMALVLLLRQPRSRPFVIEVSARGEPVALVKPLDGAPLAAQDAVTRWAIRQFIVNARTVTPGIPQQKDHLFDAYAFVKTQGYDELDAWYHDQQADRNPFDIGKKSWIQVSDIRVLKLPAPGTFQADWDETRTDYNSTVAQPSAWRATMKVESGESSERNPIGLYITTLDWAEEQR
jgi:type IV secretory pathway TrbF-like protein